MIIRFLGTHNAESKNTRLVSVLIDNVIAVDAGSLVSELSFEEQKALRAMLLSHGHYDHIRDIPAFAFNSYFNNYPYTMEVFAMQQTLNVLVSHLVDGLIYPKFTEPNALINKPVIKLHCLEIFSPRDIHGYQVTAVPLHHPIETVGFKITSHDQKEVLYLTDTGPGIDSLWERVSPHLLIVDTTYPNKMETVAREAGHLCPKMLTVELAKFRQLKGYLPQVRLIHLSPIFEAEISEEVKKVASELDVSIEIAKEGDVMVI